ncbi:MAG TPA: DUF4185 domain-containing protein [Verrucomicrobiae bacterium]|nr:DUF4185 domain-containing protein [Verrucomicrobiae bacterium]
MKLCWIFPCAALLGGCATTPALQIQHAEFGPSIWSDSQRQAGVLFQDGAQSTPVTGGALWTFGDTFLGKPVDGQPPANSQIKGATGTTIAFLPAGQTNLPPHLKYFTGADGMATNPLSLFPEEPAATNRMWPLGAISTGSRIYFYYSMIEKTDGPAPWNFHGIGGGLAVGDEPLHSFTRLRPGGHWKFPVEPIQVVRESSRLYLFEISSKPKGLILARVKVDDIEKPSAYEFYTGRDWSTNRSQVTVILREAYGQVSVVWSAARHRYLMATSSDVSRPQQIQLRESARLEGPWGEPIRIDVPDVPGKKTKLIYGAFLHPELSDDPAGHYIVTYCRMLAGEWDLTNPEWAEVTLVP